MKLGVFLPIGNGGFAITTTPPKIEPSWQLNRDIAQLAEEIGFDFAMSMIKLHGFGGPSRFWDSALDSFTLMAGLAAATKRIKVVATVPMLAMHPAITARQAMTVNEISGGRFMLNLVTGWQRAEYAQYGLWPGDKHYHDRYAYLREYTRVMQDLWATGESNFKGKYFQMEEAQCLPTPPGGRIPLVCAGRSEEGLRFTAEMADWSFISGDSEQFLDAKRALDKATAATGRKVETLPNVHLIMGATDAEAQERYQAIVDGADTEAIDRMRHQMGMNVKSGGTAGTAEAALKISLFIGTVPVIGSYETVARKLRDLHEQGLDGFMFNFSDNLRDMRDFAEHVMPRLGIEAATRV
ncbi:LLM class flavin-dependent oxidoreductase [Streptomyces sp. NPDC001393]